MKKALKIILSTVSGIIIFLIMLPIIVSMVLQISYVQKFAVDKASEILSEVANTKISIGEVALDLFTSARFGDVYVEDYRGDTMIYVKNIGVDIRGINFITGKITLGETSLQEAQINLYKDSTGMMNITEVFNNFKPKVPNPDPPTFQLVADKLELINTRFTLKEYNCPSVEYGVNYKDMSFSDINMEVNNISVYNHNIWMELANLSLAEKSGFRLDKLSSTRCGVDSSGMYYAGVEIQSAKTDIKLDSMNFLTQNQSWWDWNDFENKMILSVQFDDSYFSSSILSYLIHKKLLTSDVINLRSGELRGAVPHLKGKLTNLEFVGNRAWIDFSIKGLPDIETTLFDVKLKRLSTSAQGVDDILYKFTKNRLDEGTYKIIENLGETDFEVEFSGLISDFKGSFLARTQTSGEIQGSCDYEHLPSGLSTISGDLFADSYLLGHTLGVPKMGDISLQGDYKVEIAPESPVVLSADFNISQFYYGAYNFKDITVDGDFKSMQFTGLVTSDDPNFDFDVNGYFDFSESVPKYFMDVDLHHSNLTAIGVNKRDSVSLLSAEFVASGRGAKLDDFNGEGVIDKILYVNNHLDTIKTQAINITSIAQPEYKEVKVTSDFADVTLRGRNSFSEIGSYLTKSISRFLPSLPEVGEIVAQQDNWNSEPLATMPKDSLLKDGFYQLKFNVKKANNVAGIFMPSLQIASGSTMNFFFNPYIDQFSFQTKSDYISNDQFWIEGLEINSRNISDSLTLFSTVSLLALNDGMMIENISLLGGVRNNVITLGGHYKQNSGRSEALINTTTTFSRLSSGMPQINIGIHPTSLKFDSVRLNVAQSSVLLDTTGITVNNFMLYNDRQHYSIDGKIGRKLTDTLKVNLKNADLAPATLLISDLGYNIKGTADGELHSTAMLDSTIRMFAIVDFKDIELSGHDLGSSQLRSTIDREHNRFNFTLGNGKGNFPAMGYYDYLDRKFLASFKFDSIPMSILDPMLTGILTESSGKASTDLVLTAQDGDVLLDGKINVKDYLTTLDYTRVQYKLPRAIIDVKNSSFYLDKTPIYDTEVGKGDITAELKTTSFQNLTYNIGLNFQNLMALNTRYQDNSSFYGLAYGSGVVSVKGNQTNTNVDINAKSALNSSLIMPFSGASTVDRVDFIKYVDSDALQIRKGDLLSRLRELRIKKAKKAKKESSNNLDIRLNLEVLPNVLAQLELDAKVGDIIKGRGQGRLDMHINPDLDIFTINGPITLTEGNYLFTLQTIINKRFTVNPGGQLFWTGDATNPDINLTALYKLKTSLTPLTGSIGGGSSSVNIDCGINLTGKMLTPDIAFTITAPSADVETQNFIRNSINTQEALSMQFLSLMLANSFMPDMGTAAIGTMGTSVAGVTGLEFLSNQLSNLISNDNLNIRFGYRPQSTTTSDEFYAGVGTDLINDVLSLEVDGNYNAQNNSVNANQNPFSVDAYLTWNINKSGSLKLKGFTRTIDRFDETQGLQESGIGVYFKQDFNNYVDLKRRLRDTFKRDTVQVEEVKKKRRKSDEEREAKREKRKKRKEEKAAKREEQIGFKVIGGL